MGYHVAEPSKLEWVARPLEGQADRQAGLVTEAAELQQSRARLWRYPPHTKGRRHADHAQEEVFVVMSGTLTMLLGDPPDRIDVGPQSVVAVEPNTPLQVRNETDEELVLFIYGAPAVDGGADFFDDVPLPDPG
jgi:mannose-6-phosphate isomerase-like protein (cupin superfamily)